MKIFPVARVRELDAMTISQEPVASIDLMERAAGKCSAWLLAGVPQSYPYVIFCGPGNNGGDGLVIARHLLQKKRRVKVILCAFSENFSEDLSVNLERLKKNPHLDLTILRSGDEVPEYSADSIVIDALLGSGLNKPVSGFAAEVISVMNERAALRKIAIDIPSGLFSEDNSANDGVIFRADATLTFQFPKLAFFFAENERYCGHWEVLPIGLHPEAIETSDTPWWWVGKDDAASLLFHRGKFSHKGTFGHTLMIAGSFGKMGAAILASKAALRAGAGLVSAHIPSCGYTAIQSAVPEVMVSVDADEKTIGELPTSLNYDAVAMGPGIGTTAETQKVLKLLIQNAGGPLVLDADALNILSENPTWIAFLPAHSILTPHPGEFDRLAGKSTKGYERWQKQTEFSRKNNVFVLLKGAYSCLTTPDGKSYFNGSGNPGMATAGSGDVLTGILAGLRSQGYSSRDACILGAYWHGFAGDLAAERRSEAAMIAGDIIEFMGKALLRIRSQPKR